MLNYMHERCEGRKKEASKVKQTTRQSNTSHQRQSLVHSIYAHADVHTRYSRVSVLVFRLFPQDGHHLPPQQLVVGVTLVERQRALHLFDHLREPRSHLVEVGKGLLQCVVSRVGSIVIIVVTHKLVRVAVLAGW